MVTNDLIDPSDKLFDQILEVLGNNIDLPMETISDISSEITKIAMKIIEGENEIPRF